MVGKQFCVHQTNPARIFNPLFLIKSKNDNIGFERNCWKLQLRPYYADTMETVSLCKYGKNEVILNREGDDKSSYNVQNELLILRAVDTFHMFHSFRFLQNFNVIF